MVSVTKTWFVDDIDGVSPAVEEITWADQGIEYKAHVSREHGEEFRAFMARFKKNATKVGGSWIAPRPLRSEKWTVEDPDERKQVRDWAIGNGKYVSEYGGRTPDDYLWEYCQPNRPDKRTAVRAELEVTAVAPNDASVEAMPEPEAHKPEERSIRGQMTQEGWFYESYDDAVRVAEGMGRHAIRKDGGGLVVIELGVSYQQSLKEAAAKERATRDAKGPVVAAVKTNKNATRAVLRKLTAETSMWRTAIDSMSLETKEDFVQKAKAWLGDKTNLSHKTLDTADWDEVYGYALSTRQDEAGASAEVGSRTEPAGAEHVQESSKEAVKKSTTRRRAATTTTVAKTDTKPRARKAVAKAEAGDVTEGLVVGAPATPTRRRRVSAAART